MSKRLVYWALIASLGIFGVSLQIAEDGWGMLLYYTVLSNMLVLSFLIFLCLNEKENPLNQDKQLLRIKGGVTMAITITFVIYHFLLAPLAKPEDFWNVRNFLVHYIVPIALILDTLLIDTRKVYRWSDPFSWSLTPLFYSLFAIFNGLVTKLPVPGATDSPFPYFFINVGKYGWPTVLQNSLGIFIGYVLVGYLLVISKYFLGKKQSN
ncbi:Pr6Pr family membrane protein [Streptococcus cuniculipharyngis]|uniref:Pr6Pr family membrane protein n=1 Tax=Streptococcus cuniculipharyngis TaxID=1562651 RepID=A0A5C5SFB9_9STRE|nr:Pr6Pr family membrane protein [Streptococcus cuniculipharyngis]TWS99002.1 hypothetical protein FRX57_02020 [Streptococcus cuniculipharyngis]